jgi:hypothetical protein
MDAVFLKKERVLAEAILKIIFCEADSVANNSSPETLELAQTSLKNDTEAAFRKAVVYYCAAGNPDAQVRVTIGGVGIDSPSSLEVKYTAAFVSNRYRDFLVRGKFGEGNALTEVQSLSGVLNTPSLPVENKKDCSMHGS